MRAIVAALTTAIFLSGCATTLKPLEDGKGAVYSEQYEAPIEHVFKVAKSVAYRSPCAAATTIYDDEFRHEIYSIFRTYGMIPEYVWLVRMKRLAENSTKVELSWSPYIASEGCFTKKFFEELKSFLIQQQSSPIDENVLK